MMSIYQVMTNLISNYPTNQQEAQLFLDQLSPEMQQKLIAALYIGREHIHCSQLRTDMGISCDYIAHIPQKDYAYVLSGKSAQSVEVYFNAIKECALVSDFDLNLL